LKSSLFSEVGKIREVVLEEVAFIPQSGKYCWFLIYSPGSIFSSSSCTFFRITLLSLVKNALKNVQFAADGEENERWHVPAIVPYRKVACPFVLI
jgi:hypothetical protein